ncbi:RING-H2 finger protein ATL56-like [Mangifera indica]|uniref:RING-H2 finger protein ATL56-like n=1 Tax=Mangifera indica TaxID=29780 RepID=UPI001CFBEBF8|nr:RING-H2 finger protein ATL56-like [Mangifera indica]
MPPLHHGHDPPTQPPPPKPNTALLSIIFMAMIMTLITFFFFFLLLLGVASLVSILLLFMSLHCQHHSGADISDGFSPRGLEKLPQFRFSKRSEVESDGECVVCLEGFKQDQWCRALVKCGHVFHKNCVDTWLVKVAACPTCRTRVC